MDTKAVMTAASYTAVAAALGLSAGVGVMAVIDHNTPDPTPTETAATPTATQSPVTTGSLGHSAEPTQDAATDLPTPTEDGMVWCNAELGYVTPSDCDAFLSGGEQEDPALPSEAEETPDTSTLPTEEDPTEEDPTDDTEAYTPDQGTVTDQGPEEQAPMDTTEGGTTEEDSPYLYEGEQASECQANGGVYDYDAHSCANPNAAPQTLTPEEDLVTPEDVWTD